MAVAFDAVGPSAAGASSTNSTTLSWSHTCTGSNRLVFAGCALGKSGGDVTSWSMSATYGGTAMTSVGTQLAGSSSLTGRMAAWYLVAPASGANTIVVTAAGGTPATLAAGSVSFTGVDQSIPVGTPVLVQGASDGTSASCSVPGTSTGNFVVDTIATGSGGETSGQTLRWKKDVDFNSAAGNAAGSTAAGTGGSVSMSYTISLDAWAIIAVEVRQSVPTVFLSPQRYIARRRATLY